MFTGIKHIFFDLDHTLWDFETNSRETLADLFASHHMEMLCGTTFAEFISVYEGINHKYWQLYGANKVSKEELRYRRFYDAFLHFNYDDLSLSKTWAGDYLGMSPYKTNLVAGTREVLDYLAPKYTLHLITNGFMEVQNIKLDHSRLRGYFQHIIISEEHGFNKPDVRIFRLAESLGNTHAGECLMIGDNYESDIVGAQQAGWKAVHLDPLAEAATERPGIVIAELLALKEML